MPMVNTLLIDADGVIFTHEPYFVYMSRTKQLDKAAIDNFFKGPFKTCLRGEQDLKEVLRHYAPQMGWHGSVESLMKEWFECENEVNMELLVLLRKYKKRGMRLVLTTDQEKYRMDFILHNPDIADLFDIMYPSYKIGFLKSEPAYYAQLIQSLSPIHKSDLFYWDDTAANVKAASSYGIPSQIFDTMQAFETSMRKLINS